MCNTDYVLHKLKKPFSTLFLMEVYAEIRTIEDYCSVVYRKSKSTNSRDNAAAAMSVFQEFCTNEYKQPAYEVLKRMQKGLLSPYTVLDKFVTYMDEAKHLLPSTCGQRVHYAKRYFVFNDIDINETKFRLHVKLPTIIRAKRVPLKHETIAQVLGIVPLQVKTFILMMISSLRRPAELVQLRIRDIDLEGERPIIRIPASISKNRTENVSFLTLECKEVLLAYLGKRVKNIDEFIFPTEAVKVRHAVGKFQRMLRYHLQNSLPVLDQHDKERKSRHTITLYNFKDFAFTQVQLAVQNVEFARELKGDKTTSYSTFTHEQKLELYKQCEPHLTINNVERAKKEYAMSALEQKEQINTLTQQLSEIRKEKAITRAEMAKLFDNQSHFHQRLMESLRKQGIKINMPYMDDRLPEEKKVEE